MSTVDRLAAIATIRAALARSAPVVTTARSAAQPTARPTEHGSSVDRPACRPVRAGLHDYLTGRLLPARRRRLEAHLDRCQACTRAFIDVREVAWTQRALDRSAPATPQQAARPAQLTRRSARRTQAARRCS